MGNLLSTPLIGKKKKVRERHKAKTQKTWMTTLSLFNPSPVLKFNKLKKGGDDTFEKNQISTFLD